MRRFGNDALCPTEICIDGDHCRNGRLEPNSSGNGMVGSVVTLSLRRGANRLGDYSLDAIQRVYEFSGSGR